MTTTILFIFACSLFAYTAGRLHSLDRFHRENMSHWKAHCLAETFRSAGPCDTLSDLELIAISRTQRLTLAAASLRQAALNTGGNVIELKAVRPS